MAQGWDLSDGRKLGDWPVRVSDDQFPFAGEVAHQFREVFLCIVQRYGLHKANVNRIQQSCKERLALVKRLQMTRRAKTIFEDKMESYQP